MRFLADANIAPATIENLRKGGFNVKSVFEEGLQKATDSEIIQKAAAENRIILTHDKDFGNILVYPLILHKGVILIRLKNQKPRNASTHLLSFLKSIPSQKIKNNLIILSEKGARIYKN
jgi:predicted nuclease of predicted toxin-antitoxin system